MGLIDRLASTAPVPVLLVPGAGGATLLEPLRIDDRFVPVPSPRHATVLVGAGAIPAELLEPLKRLHDGMSRPRAITWLVSPEQKSAPDLPGLVRLEPPHADGLSRVRADLLAGRVSSSGALLADEDPAPWRGVGPYGQGGSGMTGGVPYGRPMAGLAPDRDGLRLDRLPTTVGPWFPFLPAGLRLRVGFAGDVLSGVDVIPAPGQSSDGLTRDPFLRALVEPVSIAALETARARSHLRALALALEASGLAALGRRTRRIASGSSLDPRSIAGLTGAIRRAGFLRWSTRDVGVLPRDLVVDASGPIARAAGISADERADIPEYVAAGFAPVTARDGDGAERWRVRLAEVSASIAIAARGRDVTVGPLAKVEGPRGVISSEHPEGPSLAGLLPAVIDGMEWGDALATILSLDLGDEGYRRAVPEHAPVA